VPAFVFSGRTPSLGMCFREKHVLELFCPLTSPITNVLTMVAPQVGVKTHRRDGRDFNPFFQRLHVSPLEDVDRGKPITLFFPPRMKQKQLAPWTKLTIITVKVTRPFPGLLPPGPFRVVSAFWFGISVSPWSPFGPR